MKITKMSREEPTAVPTAKTVVVKAGLPKDRLKGYLGGRRLSTRGMSADEKSSGIFTGADAQAALVGKYKKRNRKGFGEGKRHERSESRSKERSEMPDDDY